uniref:GOLD domain-containing protein n=1 Tax=Caenorhabditis japonica TaxID=281687 RepID=A0A8R1I7Q7_CAEJA
MGDVRKVIDGGDLNINFMILHGANILKQDQLKVDGSHRIELNQPGDYQVCFDNSFSYQSRKVVFFEIFLFDANGNLDETDLSAMARTDADLSAKMNELGVTIDEFHVHVFLGVLWYRTRTEKNCAKWNRLKLSFTDPEPLEQSGGFTNIT